MYGDGRNTFSSFLKSRFLEICTMSLAKNLLEESIRLHHEPYNHIERMPLSYDVCDIRDIFPSFCTFLMLHTGIF